MAAIICVWLKAQLPLQAGTPIRLSTHTHTPSLTSHTSSKPQTTDISQVSVSYLVIYSLITFVVIAVCIWRENKGTNDRRGEERGLLRIPKRKVTAMECYNTSITAVGSLIKNSVSRRLWVFRVPVWKCGKIGLSLSLSLSNCLFPWLSVSFLVHLNSG